MKKKYFTILVLFLFVALANAQSTTIDFSDTSYDPASNPGVDTNLNNHPNWNADAPWSADIANKQIKISQANSKRAVYTTPIKANVGEVLSVKVLVKLGTDDQFFKNYKTFLLVAFQGSTAITGDTGDTSSTREGVVIYNSISGPSGERTVGLASQGKSYFESSNPAIGVENKSTYEIIFEIEVGANAASTIIKSRLRNVGAKPSSSQVRKAAGINDVIYNAIVGDGAYLLLYDYNAFNGTLGTDYFIDTIYVLNKIEINVSAIGSLSTEEFNDFEFSISPNPVKDLLTINTKETLEKIEIYNLLGMKVLSSTSSTVDVSSLSNSTYLIKLTSDRGVSTMKLFKN